MAARSRRPLCVNLVPDTHDAGAENQARYLLDGLNANGEFATELVYFGAGRAHPSFEDTGVPALHVPRLRRFRYDIYGRARRLRRAYRDRPPDILHTWLLEANVIGLLAARAWPWTKVVITQRGSWNELDYKGHLRLQRLLLGRADQAISNSTGGAEMLAQMGLDPAVIAVIPNGIPPERVHVAADRAETRGRLGWDRHEVVVWVGRVDDDETVGHKDFGSLFVALEKLRSIRPGVLLALVGPTRDELEERGFSLPEWALPLGWQAHPAEIVDAADALALSSRFEGDSNVVGEALLLGLPVVSTDCGGHCAAVRRAGGRVVPTGDPETLARGLAEILARPPDRAEVRERAREALSVERMVDRTTKVYRELLSG